MKFPALATLALSASLLLTCVPVHAQTTDPQTTKDQQEQLKKDEKANKEKAKASHDQRKALRQQDKAEKAAKKAAEPKK